MKPPVRVLLVGAAGRMGKTIVDLARRNPNIQIVAKCDLGDAIEPAMKDCDVVIDFSHADAVDEICRTALRHGKSLVIGTTGHSQEQRRMVEDAGFHGLVEVEVLSNRWAACEIEDVLNTVVERFMTCC